jgi:hypothetical protein
MLEVWDAWLRVPEARQDPGYEAIEGVVRKFVPAPTAESLAEGKTRKSTQRRRKKKSAKKTSKK